MAESKITKEVEPRIEIIDLPLDYEERVCDLAIAILCDILECDKSRIYVKWVELVGHEVPLLYVLFSGKVNPNMPKVHIDESGQMHPAHAICLAKMPSGHLMNDAEMRSVIRKGVEGFLTKYRH